MERPELPTLEEMREYISLLECQVAKLDYELKETRQFLITSKIELNQAEQEKDELMKNMDSLKFRVASHQMRASLAEDELEAARSDAAAKTPTCSICLEDIELGNLCAFVPCGHANTCIDCVQDPVPGERARCPECHSTAEYVHRIYLKFGN